MKKIIITLSILVYGLIVVAQSSTKNYIKETTARNELPSLEFASEDQVNVTVTYYDGLGRPEQVIGQEASPDKKDIVSVIGYDPYGRQWKSYLPYASAGTTGDYRPSWSSEISTAYNSLKGEPTYHYSKTEYEMSPSSRIKKQLSPGSEWVGANPERGISSRYSSNAANVVFRLYVSGTGLVSTSGSIYYPANELLKTTVTDEDGKQTVEYIDKSGQVICKISDHTGLNAKTYYLYDDFGLLRYVVQPQGVSEMGTNLEELNSFEFRNKWMFQYTYDKRHRMIIKKVPGAEPVFMVYDRRDRLVLSQDGNQRGVDVNNIGTGNYETDQYKWINYDISTGSVTLKPGFSFTATSHRSFYAGENAQTIDGEWMFTKYDVLNRPVMTGIVSLSGNRESIQQTIDNDLGYDFVESYVGTGTIFGYDNTAYPSVIADDVLTVTYYDNYDFKSDLSFGGNYNSNVSHSTAISPLVTGSLKKDLRNGNMLKSIRYYDDQYRVWVNVTENHLGGYDRHVLEYFSDVNPLVTKDTHTHSDGSTITTIVISNTYDHNDRLLTTTHKINSQSTVTLAENSYNEIGELITKDLGGSGSPVQSVDYQYNIRGWLTTINGGTGFSGSDKFGMQLTYDDAQWGYKHYNGNIGEIHWKSLDNSSSTYDGAQTYSLKYDALNRLRKADYTNASSQTTYYDVYGSYMPGHEIPYDLNGNLQNLKRKDKGNLIDNMVYQYHGNQLTSVSDSETDTGTGFEEVGSPGQQPNEYLYDPNGNMTSDANQSITSIAYNHLNLPEQVTFSDGDYLKYTYDAAGIKMSRERKDGAQTTTAHYIGPFHYDGSSINFVQHEEGRARKSGSTFLYEYNLTDHLGNVRVTVDAGGGVIQRDDYYPFGGTFNEAPSTNPNLYKYNGKEEQELTGWSGWYDYGARMYDPWLGRWHLVDRMSNEDHNYSFSPYNYCINNPLRYIDPNGEDWVEAEDGTITWRDDVYTNRRGRVVGLNDGETYRGRVYRRFENIGDEKYNDVNYNSDQTVSSTQRDRPDIDGVVTNDEALDWYHYGGGEPLTVDIGQFRFNTSDLSVEDFTSRERNALSVNFFNIVNIHASNSAIIYRPAGDRTLSHVYGTIRLGLVDAATGEVRVITRDNGSFDTYNFSWIGRIVANAQRRNGNPREFEFFGTGTGQIRLR